MRAVLCKLRSFPDHRGLTHDVWAPIVTAPDGAKSMERPGKLDPEHIEAWHACLTRARHPADYDIALTRWKRSFAGKPSLLFHGRTSSRLLVGHGNPAPTDVGLTLQHTWGVPMIPGSALEGLLAHYVAANYGPCDDSEAIEQPVRQRFAGPEWKDDKLIGPPGDIYGRLFGVPPLRDHRGAQLARRGELIVHDALWDWAPAKTEDQPAPGAEDERMLARDVLTVHHKQYYDSGGASAPNDWDSPNPVGFLSVPPGARFLFALSCDDEHLLARAARYLRAALRDWGVGGKTAAGYGRFEGFEHSKKPRAQANDPILADLRTFFAEHKREKTSQRAQLAQLEQTWLERLRQLPAQHHDDVRRLLSKYIKSAKLADQRERLLQAIATDPGAAP